MKGEAVCSFAQSVRSGN